MGEFAVNETMQLMPSTDLAKANAILAEASQVALLQFAQQKQSVHRANNVTNLHHNAYARIKELIAERLSKAFPGEDCVFDVAPAQRPISKSRWLIKPIDGFGNFIQGVPLWGISIGRMVEGRLKLGVVALPAQNQIVSAEVGQGMFLNGQKYVRDNSNGAVRIVSIGESYFDLENSISMTRAMRLKGWGVEFYRSPSVSFALAAIGLLDGYLDRYIRSCDVAGGMVLCIEAGLLVKHGPLEGGPFWVEAGTREMHAVVKPYFERPNFTPQLIPMDFPLV